MFSQIRLIYLSAPLLVFTMTSCSKPVTPQQEQTIQRNAATATQQVKRGVQQLGRDLKPMTANVAHGVSSVAKGIHQGLRSETAKDGRINVNVASTATLATLPGVSRAKARAIVRGRPYSSTQALVDRGLLTSSQYDRIADQITAN